jgi:hypothetical protein
VQDRADCRSHRNTNPNPAARLHVFLLGHITNAL